MMGIVILKAIMISFAWTTGVFVYYAATDAKPTAKNIWIAIAPSVATIVALYVAILIVL